MVKTPAAESTLRSPAFAWGGVLAFWAFLGFWVGNQTFFEMRGEGMQHEWWRVVLWNMLVWLVWAPLTPLIFFLARRFAFHPGKRFVSAVAHLIGYAAVVSSQAFCSIYLRLVINPYFPIERKNPLAVQFYNYVKWFLPYGLFIYVAILLACYAFDYRHQLKEREIRTAQLETHLAQAQVVALKMQLHPHFLFNTLNGIAALVRENENDRAVMVLLGLSNMLRYALDNSGRHEVPLSEELEFLELYLNIEQMRFPDRLRIEMQIEPESLNAQVPNLLLQPLVENAIRHGIAPRLAPGTVGVEAETVGEELRLRVYDDGVGMGEKAPSAESCGIGLQNTRMRLQQLYGTSASLSLRERAQGGVEVLVSLPFRIAEA